MRDPHPLRALARVAVIASLLGLAATAGCAVRAAPLPLDHPANPRAPVGRLADAPASLRPAAAQQPPSKPAEPAQPHHH